MCKIKYLCWLWICVICMLILMPNGVVWAVGEELEINLIYAGNTYTYKLADNVPEVRNFWESKKLQRNNRLGNMTQKVRKIEEIQGLGFGILDALDYMLFGFKNYYNAVREDIEREVCDAEIKFQPRAIDKFAITKEVVGVRLDDEEVLGEVLDAMRVSNIISVEIKPKFTLPQYTEEELRQWRRRLASFSTKYDTSSANRKHNVRLALSKFDGMILYPDQEVSFNNVTGRRTKQNGYREAKIIQDKEYVEAYGGGVCQSSTTLYNALILAGVEIREVHSHSLAPNYIEYGFDAMVNYGTSDLRFCNTMDTPVYIHTKCNESMAVVEIFGKGADNYTRKRVSKVLEKIQPQADKVVIDVDMEYKDKVWYEDEEWYKTYPKDGYKVEGYMEYYDGDKLLNRRKIREVRYYAVRGVKIKGSKQRIENENVDVSNWNILDKLLA